MAALDPVAIAIPERGDVEPAAHVDIASAAEVAGFDLLLIPESWGMDAFTRLGYLAAHTESIHLGTGIVNVFSRSPALLAQSVATLDRFTDGRAVLGLGVSSPAVVEGWHGVEWEPALRRQREVIEVVRLALTGDEVDYDGRVFDLEHFRLRFEPVRRDVPIYVAALGETNCELTGAFADGWMPNRLPRSGLPARREHVDRGARTRDRDPAAVKTIPWVPTCVLADDPDHARDRCRRHVAFYVAAMGEFTRRTIAALGYADETDEIQARWDEGDRDAATAAVTDALLRDLAIAGPPSVVPAALERYAAVADGVVLQPPTWATADEVAETIRHVAPHLPAD